MLNSVPKLPPEDPISHPADEAPLDAYSRTVTAVVDRVGPAVVRVQSAVEGRHHGGIGSGVIIAGDGLVLTNSHVIGGTKHARLAFAEGGEAEAEVLGDDPDTDLALLRTELPTGTPAARLGNSKALRRGQLVVRQSFGFKSRLTAGVVSAFARSLCARSSRSELRNPRRKFWNERLSAAMAPPGRPQSAEQSKPPKRPRRGRPFGSEWRFD